MANPNFKENKIRRFIAKSLQPLLRVCNKKLYISLQYKYITGHKLDWSTLLRYTEKLQYLRLYVYPNMPEVIHAASRRGARELVEAKGYKDILIPIYGIYEKFDDINFANLPKQFVMKATHASGFNYICLNKDEIDFSSLRKRFNRYLKMDYGKKTVEPHYSKIKPEIIIEQYIGEKNELPTEYKIHVFNGKARYLYVVTGRGRDIKYNNYYINWQAFNEAQFNHWQTSGQSLKAPKNYEEMVKIAEQLASDFPFVRVDFYVVNGQIYFGEFTFTPAKGTLVFDEDSADFTIGKWLDISQFINN